MNGTYRARLLGLLVVVGALAAATPAPASTSAYLRPKKTFSAETKGSPEATIRGTWNEETGGAPSEAHLTFSGGHTAGEYTYFEGSWISPPTTSNKSPEMLIDYRVAYGNSAAKDVHLVQAFRARYVGGKWGKWVKRPIVLQSSKANVESDGARIIVPLDEPRRLFFQWRISGRILSPTGLAGDFKLSVS